MGQMSLEIGYTRPKGQVFKWLGSKFKFAYTITAYFPEQYNRYIEPFIGAGAMLATVAPEEGIAGDALAPLIEAWKILQEDPEHLIEHYTTHFHEFVEAPKETYARILSRYNETPNGPDLLVLTRTCYGGVVRFTKEGKMSTPSGMHKPMSIKTFRAVVHEWRERLKGTTFYHQSFEETMAMAKEGDLVYCDPPYIASQRILYGAQSFQFQRLLEVIESCKSRGVKVVLSIDGKKKSGKQKIALEVPDGLFEREHFVSCGASMLRRFQKSGEKMKGEDVHDRLLLTW
ncbi:MAG: DNA methyltransferase [Deltaproteobacteria bacterium]|nr:DNA methyltransferase [Deltaproteobacteria bacterium]|tara:strand:- start:9976 stop:10836 length:861 start_codon:yes stop_codon:yes gene_type:complete